MYGLASQTKGRREYPYFNKETEAIGFMFSLSFIAYLPFPIKKKVLR